MPDSAMPLGAVGLLHIWRLSVSSLQGQREERCRQKESNSREQGVGVQWVHISVSICWCVGSNTETFVPLGSEFMLRKGLGSLSNVWTVSGLRKSLFSPLSLNCFTCKRGHYLSQLPATAIKTHWLSEAFVCGEVPRSVSCRYSFYVLSRFLHTDWEVPGNAGDSLHSATLSKRYLLGTCCVPGALLCPEKGGRTKQSRWC